MERNNSFINYPSNHDLLLIFRSYISGSLLCNSYLKFTFGLFLISSLIMLSYDFSFTDSHNAYAAKNYCKGVKTKDDGKNDFNIIIGSSQIGISECIIGTDDRDVILGLDGPDYIKGKDDNDNLQGGYSDDKLYGNDGHDNNQGGPGQDLVYGNDDNDVLFGGFDPDFISGGKGNDEMYGDFGEDMLEGGPGADYFDCGENYDIVLDYDPGDGDILANNCEQVIRAH